MSESYSFDTKDELKKFVIGIYKPDRTPTKRVMTKFKAMRKHGNAIKVIYIEIDKPSMIPHKKTRLLGTFYCKEMKLLKKIIRNKYKGGIKGYVHDIIIHISDNEGHNKRTKKLLAKYAKKTDG